MKSVIKSYSLLVLVFLAALLIIAKVKYHQKNIFALDNFGYYLYLPSQFIYKDPGFENFKRIEEINAKYQCTPTYYQIMQSPKGKLIIRMYAGIAVLLTPAFFIGHSIALLSHYPADGFSIPYQNSVIVFGVLLSLLGMFFARKILLKYFPDKLVALVLLIMYLGTNLLFFVNLGNPMPHTYLFNLYIFLIWFTIRWHQEPKIKYAIGIGALLGLIISIRPSDLIVVFIPLLWGVYSKESLLAKLKLILLYWKQLFVLCFVVSLFALPQVLYWRMNAGEFVVSVYTDPGSQMNWSNPKFLNTLFSFRKGWITYSPLIILALAGIFISLWRHRLFFLYSFFFVALNLYMISCFTSLISYGYRAFIQSYAVLLLPLGVAVEFILMRPKWVSWLIFAIIAVFAYLNFVQAWQTGTEVIHGSRMTKAAYFNVLGRWNAKQPKDLYLIKRSGASIDTMGVTNNYSIKKILDFSYESDENHTITGIDSTVSYYGKNSLCLGNDPAYAKGIKIPVADLLNDKDHFWIKANIEVLSLDTAAASNCFLVAEINSDNLPMKYRGISIRQLKGKFVPGQWNNIRFDYLSPEFMPEDAILKVYFWNNTSSKVWIDDFKIYLYTLKD